MALCFSGSRFLSGWRVLTEFQNRPASVRRSYDSVLGLISQWVQGELESNHVEFPGRVISF